MKKSLFTMALLYANAIILSISEAREEKERIDGRPRRKFLTLTVGNPDNILDKPSTINVWQNHKVKADGAGGFKEVAEWVLDPSVLQQYLGKPLMGSKVVTFTGLEYSIKNPLNDAVNKSNKVTMLINKGQDATTEYQKFCESRGYRFTEEGDVVLEEANENAEEAPLAAAPAVNEAKEEEVI